MPGRENPGTWQRSAAAFDRAIRGEQVIRSEINRIWSSNLGKGLHRTDLARLRIHFNPTLLPNLRTGKPLSTRYRGLILGFAYKLYGQEQIKTLTIPKPGGVGAADNEAINLQTLQGIEKNVEKIVPFLAHFLMHWNKGYRTELPEAEPEKRRKKVVIFDLPSTKAEKARDLFEQHIIKALKRMKQNNGTIKKILEDMDTFGREKIDVVRNRIKENALDAEDVIIVTDKLRLELFEKGEFENSSKTAIDPGEEFDWETQYYPYVEAAFFAILMGLVNDYYNDTKLLKKYKNLLWKWYKRIPNIEQIDEETLIHQCFEPDGKTPKKTVILKLIPNATKFDPDKLQKLYERIEEIIRKA